MVRSGKKHILITGNPGVGKTTLIRKIADELRHSKPVGFYTEEIREHGTRKGFELVGLDGTRAILSHVTKKSTRKVGRYGVDVDGFESFLSRLDLSRTGSSPVVIDEIGKMECFSERFINMVEDVLASENVLIATVAMKGGGFIDDIKRRNDVIMFEVTRENRNNLSREIVSKINNLY